MFNPNENTSASEFLATIILIAIGIIVAPSYSFAGAIIASLLGLASFGEFMNIRENDDLLSRKILLIYAGVKGGAAILITYLTWH